MKNKIKNWLGLRDLTQHPDIARLAGRIFDSEKEIRKITSELEEYRRDNKYLTMCVRGMLDHLDLDWHREEILDPSVFYQQPTISIIRFAKRKKLTK